MSIRPDSNSQWHADEERWWNQYGEYMTYQWQLTPSMSERVRGELERDYKEFLLDPGGSLLDIGCGSGWLSAYFATRGMTVVGVDISQEQINAADKLKASLGLENLRFQCADMMNWDTDIYQSTFTHIFVSAFLHHLPSDELERMFRKIAFVLKPGGKVYLYEPLQCRSARRLPLKVIDRIYNITVQIFIDRLPRWFNWWGPRHLLEMERGYQMSSPHEAPVNLEQLRSFCEKEFNIIETRGWHLSSLGFAMQTMGLIDKVRDRYLPLVSLFYRIDTLLFRWFGWEAFSLPGRFILCSVKMTRK